MADSELRQRKPLPGQGEVQEQEEQEEELYEKPKSSARPVESSNYKVADEEDDDSTLR